MKLSIVIVNTNEWKVLYPCLRSVFEQTGGFPYEVIVVDNASTDGSRAHIAREFPNVQVVANDRNRGFAASNNRGFMVAKGDYILMLNPDTVVKDHAIERTIEFMDHRPEIGIAACRLRLPNGTIQSSVGRFPSIWHLFCETFFLEKAFPRTRLFGDYFLRWFNYEESIEVDWVCGAFLLMRRTVLDTVGYLDTQFYMYSEEVDFCFRAKKNGYKVWFSPAGEIVHFWGGLNATSKRTIYWTVGSQILLFQKHFQGGSRIALVALKYIGILLRVPVYFVLGVVTANRSLTAKASYFFFTAWNLAAKPWRYRQNYTGDVEPWPRVS